MIQSEKSIFNYKEIPNNIKFFKMQEFNDVLCIPDDKPDMENISDMFISADVHDMKLIKTEKGLSNEGNSLLGNKLLVEILFKEKLIYVSDKLNENVFVVYSEILKSAFVALPEYVDGKNVLDMYKSSRLTVTPYLLHVDTRLLSKRNINISLLAFLDIQFCYNY